MHVTSHLVHCAPSPSDICQMHEFTVDFCGSLSSCALFRQLDSSLRSVEDGQCVVQECIKMRSELHVSHCPSPAAFQTFLPQLLCLDSTGSLPVEWDLQRVGDMGVGVELENWVEPSRPRNDKEKLHDFIVQEGLLQLQPPVGQLGPGESTTWTITYR